MHSIPCSCGKVLVGKIYCSLKVSQEEHQKAVIGGEIKKLGMADHIWKEKGNNLPLWDEDEIIEREEHWRIRHFKEPVRMLSYSDLLSRQNIEMNMIWEPIIKSFDNSFFKIAPWVKIIHNSNK